MTKLNKIRVTITAGWDDLDSLYRTIQSFAEFKNFEISFNKTKQWRDTPIYEQRLELIQIEDRKS
tara:strand:- start:596 stop:790 length:195 start_codon:yes stop_codon:yes gene_type:complete